MDRTIIDRYEAQGEALGRAIAGLTREQLLATPVPGKWSLQQLVLHLTDAECVMADRIKRVIAEKEAALLAFDENRWTERLHYDAQSAADAAAMVAIIRRQLARVLRKLPDAAFDRIGMHSEAGPLTLLQLVEKACAHLDHHLKFAAEKRRILEK